MTAPVAEAAEKLDLILGMQQLSDSRILLNDAGHLRLLIFDSTLTNFSILADGSGKAGDYGASPAQLIPYLADSSLFVQSASRTLLLIDNVGKIVRTLALPKSADIGYVGGSRVAIDLKGRLVYRAAYATTPLAPILKAGTYVTQPPDSAPLVRADFESRQIDTLAVVKIVKSAQLSTTRTDAGTISSRTVVYPLSTVDDWDVLSDGSLAIVRGHDYHVDWMNSDGDRVSSQKMPFDWLRLSDEDKRRLADSARTSHERQLRPNGNQGSKAPSSGDKMTLSMSLNRTDGTRSVSPTNTVVENAPLEMIPDYFPPLRSGSVRADRENNLWVLPTTTSRGLDGQIVYDIIRNHGRLAERVRLPVGRSIVGFGANGAVFLTWRDSSQSWHFEKRRVKR
ncbi:MAG: hypothetical protein ABJC26_10115 [Gemmatimonadaceae bacterium]